MSAWMCTDCHISILARFAVDHGLTDKTALELGAQLHAANRESLIARYAERAAEYWPEKPFVLCAECHAPTVQILKLAHCYSYQACEVPQWEATPTRALIETIQKAAIYEVLCEHVYASPAYDSAKWGWKHEDGL